MGSRTAPSRFGWTVAAVLSAASAVPLAQAADVEFSGGSPSEIRLKAGGSMTTSQSVANLMPGNSVKRTIVVENDGPAELLYALSISSDHPDGSHLGDVLAVTIWTADEFSPGPCEVLGPALYAGTLGADGGFGKPQAGADRGDRTLGPGAVDILCVRISLPLEADNAYQGARTTAAFTVSAEQTRDNP